MKKLAKIRHASLEMYKRGILTFWIHVDYEDGFSQGIGGLALDSFDKDKQRRVGTAYGCEMIRALLLELNVNDFSEMKGKHIFILGDDTKSEFIPIGVQGLSTNGGSQAGVVFSHIADQFQITGKEGQNNGHD